MDEFIKLLDNNLQYINREIINNTIYVEVASTKDSVKCPYSGVESKKIHLRYKKSFQDLPIQVYKVIVTLNNRKFFCNNPYISKKTFAETFDFLLPNAKKSKMLDNEIINISINVISVTASKVIKSKVPNVCKSTICNLLKKLSKMVNKSTVTKVCIDDLAMKIAIHMELLWSI